MGKTHPEESTRLVALQYPLESPGSNLRPCSGLITDNVPPPFDQGPKPFPSLFRLCTEREAGSQPDGTKPFLLANKAFLESLGYAMRSTSHFPNLTDSNKVEDLGEDGGGALGTESYTTPAHG